MRERTHNFRCVPIGEKGVGRFAAHKLGNKVRLITRKANSAEVLVDIDWENDFKHKKYLEEVEIRVVERTPEYLLAKKQERGWKSPS